MQFVISENLARIAVPLFFFISGFFLSIKYDGTFQSYRDQLKKRVKSVLLPYVLFCLLWALPYVVIGQELDIIRIFTHPIPFQFWFLQHLLVLVLASWLIYKLKRFRVIILSLLIVLYVFSSRRWGGVEESLLFFTVGLYNSHIRNVRLPRTLIVGACLVFAALVVINCIVGVSSPYANYIQHLMVVSGFILVLAWLFGSNAFVNPVISAGASFFIFAMHEPLLSMMKSVAVTRGLIDTSVLGMYFLLPALVILICYASFKGLGAIMPKSLSMLVGGRKL